MLSSRPARPEAIALELLLQAAHPSLHLLLRRCMEGGCGGLAGLFQELLDLLRQPERDGAKGNAAPGAPCLPEEIAALGERALELEELAEVVRCQWCGKEERQAAHLKLLRCGVDSPQALLRALSSPRGGTIGAPEQCLLNNLLEEAGFKCLRRDSIVSLTADLEVRQQRIEVAVEGDRPFLATAPHNIYLRRDGHSTHAMEDYTTLIAQRVARQLGGSCIVWSRPEQHRSELFWFLGCRQFSMGEVADPGVRLDARNRDPNYLSPEEILQNPWFRHMQRISDSFQGGAAQPRLSLHVDIHGCRDPPCTPSHLTVGLAAMRQQADARRGCLTLAQVEAFAAAFEAEFSTLLRSLVLRPKAPLVRVLLPSSNSVERLSGAWPAEEKRFTQTQQAIKFAGFTHSCQLELSRALRRVLVQDESATHRFGKAINQVWLASTGTSIPPLPRMPHITGSSGALPYNRQSGGTTQQGGCGRQLDASASLTEGCLPRPRANRGNRSGANGALYRSCPPQLRTPARQ